MMTKFCRHGYFCFRWLRSEGVGTEVRHAPIVTASEKEQIWESSVLSITTIKVLQSAYLLNGKVFL